MLRPSALSKSPRHPAPSTRLRPLLALALLGAALSAHAADHSHRKALLIGVDGMQYERLLEAIDQGTAPNIASLQLGKSYVGGIMGSQTQAPTNSGPGWATMLTGTWVDRHGVQNNGSSWRSLADSVFKQIKRADPMRRTASIVSWGTINDNFANDIANGYVDLALKCHDVDQCVADAASQELEHADPDFVFAHFDEPDLAGHSHGFTAPYQDAIQGVDAQVGQVLAALKRRQHAHPDEDWLVIVAPDHGRVMPSGYGHGDQTLSEKTTFIAINKPANAQLTTPVVRSSTDPLDNLYGHASQADITPTILKHLGVPLDMTGHRMDGLPLIGQVGARQLAYTIDPAGSAVTLNWRLTGANVDSQLLRIFRNGQPVAVLIGKQSFTDSTLPAGEGDLNYTVVTQQVATSLLVERGQAD